MRFQIKETLSAKPQPCYWRDCEKEGIYPAPKNPGCHNQYQLFCLEHIRLYNQNWNYFLGMDETQIHEFQKDSISGHRPTRKSNHGMYVFHAADILQDTLQDFGLNNSNQPQVKEQFIAESELSAIKLLGLTYPINLTQIKRCYKALAKNCHPDIHGSASEEAFKRLNEAYRYLKTIYT